MATRPSWRARGRPPRRATRAAAAAASAAARYLSYLSWPIIKLQAFWSLCDSCFPSLCEPGRADSHHATGRSKRDSAC